MTAAHVVVSIEAGASAQTGGGHVAAGWLVEPTRVVVPDPPPGLLDGSLDVEVVLAAADESPVERIPPAEVNALRAAIAAHGGDARAAFESAGTGPPIPGDKACAKHNIVNCARCS
jgi:hypothetical protein